MCPKIEVRDSHEQPLRAYADLLNTDNNVFITGFIYLWSSFEVGDFSKLAVLTWSNKAAWVVQSHAPRSWLSRYQLQGRLSLLLLHNYCFTIIMWISEALINWEWSLSIKFELWLKLPSHSPVLAANMEMASCQIGSNRPLRHVLHTLYFIVTGIFTPKSIFIFL